MCYQNHSFIRDLQLADMSFTGEANVDILIGEDLYCYRRDERSESCNIVAINSAFDWATKGDLDLTVCTFTAHVLKIGCNETETTNLNDKIHRFWDQIGIFNKELSVNQKSKNNITLQNGCYSLKQLQSLKIRLAKDEML